MELVRLHARRPDRRTCSRAAIDRGAAPPIPHGAAADQTTVLLGTGVHHARFPRTKTGHTDGVTRTFHRDACRVVTRGSNRLHDGCEFRGRRCVDAAATVPQFTLAVAIDDTRNLTIEGVDVIVRRIEIILKFRHDGQIDGEASGTICPWCGRGVEFALSPAYNGLSHPGIHPRYLGFNGPDFGGEGGPCHLRIKSSGGRPLLSGG